MEIEFMRDIKDLGELRSRYIEGLEVEHNMPLESQRIAFHKNLVDEYEYVLKLVGGVYTDSAGNLKIKKGFDNFRNTVDSIIKYAFSEEISLKMAGIAIYVCIRKPNKMIEKELAYLDFCYSSSHNRWIWLDLNTKYKHYGLQKIYKLFPGHHVKPDGDK